MSRPAYVHVGAAKAASKALQRHLFSAHPELGHLGLGHAGPMGWATAELQRRVEADLRCLKPLLYDARPVRVAWEAAIASLPGGLARAGISYENLSLTLGMDVDVTEKARRVRQMMGLDTVVVLVVREQRALIRSCYAELLLNGLDLPFQQAVDHWLRGHARSWVSDLCFSRAADAWATAFSDDAIHVVVFEELIADPARALSELQVRLGVSPIVRALPRENPGLAPERLALLLSLNQRMRHDLSDRRGGLLQADRLAAHLGAWWPELSDVPAYANAALGRAAARSVRAPDAPAMPPLERRLSVDQQQMLRRLYGDDNAALADRLGRPLPSSYLQPPSRSPA